MHITHPLPFERINFEWTAQRMSKTIRMHRDEKRQWNWCEKKVAARLATYFELKFRKAATVLSHRFVWPSARGNAFIYVEAKANIVCVKYTWPANYTCSGKKGDAVSCKTEDRIMHIDRITRRTQIFYVHIDSAFFTSAFAVQSAWCGSSRRGHNEWHIVRVEGKLHEL